MERLVQEMGAANRRGIVGSDWALVISALAKPSMRCTGLQTQSQSSEALPLSKAQTGQRGSVTISGVGNLAHQLAKCCKPVAGDSVRSYHWGRGVTVHRVDCPDLMALYEAEPQRVVDVEWGDSDKSYPVDLIISAYDRSGLLRDVSGGIKHGALQRVGDEYGLASL